MSMTPQFELVPDGDAHTFCLRGELDLATAAELLSALHPVLRAGTRLRLKLSDLDFLDCSGLHALVSAAEALLPGGSLILEAPTGEVAKVLELVRADLIPGVEITEGAERATVQDGTVAP